MRTKDELMVAMFNRLYEVGDEIQMLDDYGLPFTAVVRFKAGILGGHTPVVWLENIGSYALERLIIT
jgi:hypothetical protein